MIMAGCVSSVRQNARRMLQSHQCLSSKEEEKRQPPKEVNFQRQLPQESRMNVHVRRILKALQQDGAERKA